jgi:putative ABC transport system permease protein
VMASLSNDLKFSARLLLRSPLFTVSAVLVLGISIGANTAIFSVIEAVILKPLPYFEPQRLVAINAVNSSAKDGNIFVTSYTKFQEIQRETQSLEKVAAYYPITVSLTTRREAEAVSAVRVSVDFFSSLGTSPQMGRSFSSLEDQPGGADVAVISDGFWHSHFGADPEIIGKALTLDGSTVTVIGILPRSFRFPPVFPEPQAWLPRVFETTLMKPEIVRSGGSFLSIVARMRDGETLSQVESELDTINLRYRQQFGSYADATRLNLFAQKLDDSVVGNLRRPLAVLLAAVGLILLIACANLASMFLARATARQREMAIRRAMGATRLRLIRQLLAESAALSLLGGVFGVGLAFCLLSLSGHITPGAIPRLEQARVDLPVLLFAMTMCALATAAFGLAPAWQISGGDLRKTLNEGGRHSSDGQRQTSLRSVLVVGEIAAALVLMTGAGLLTKSFVRTLSLCPGFDATNVTTFPLALPESRYPQPEEQARFAQNVLEAIREIPKLDAAGITSSVPLTGTFRMVFFCPEGFACQGLGRDPLVSVLAVTADYFRTMRTHLLRGRVFTEQDLATTEPVVIVNQAVAERYWPNQDPIGKHLANSRDRIQRVVVGVVENLRYNTLTSPITDEMYLPFLQEPRATPTLVVRSAANPETLATAVREAISKTDSNLAITHVESLGQVVSDSVAQPRLTLEFTAVFASLALLLSAIGLYAVMAFSVSRRSQELGIRMALGAKRSDILGLVLRQGMGVTLLGVGCGVVASLALTRVIAGLLYEIRATDPIAFGGAALVLTLAALVACYLPAERAASLDPMRVLRCD